MKLLKNVNKNIYIYNMSESSISESMNSGTSESSIQDGGSDMMSPTMLALCVSTSTILLTCVILICIIHNKSNC